MQNFLREQKYNSIKFSKSLNFVQYSILKFISFLKFLNVYCVDVGVMILNFLIECVQGPCHENQALLAKSKIIDGIKDLMYMFSKKSNYKKRGFISTEDEEKMSNFLTLSNKLLLSLIEGKK